MIELNNLFSGMAIFKGAIQPLGIVFGFLFVFAALVFFAGFMFGLGWILALKALTSVF